MDRQMKWLSVTLAVMTTTAVTLYFLWQFILSIPSLKSIVAYVLTAVLMLGEIFYVWWYFNYVKAQYQRNQVEIKLIQQQITSGAPPVGLLNSGTTNATSIKKSQFPLLLGIIMLLFTFISSTLIYQKQNQISASSYLHVYGDLLLSDQLQQPDQWQNISRAFYGNSCQFIDGAYHVNQAEPENTFTCPSIPTFKNFALEAEMVVLKGDCGGVNVRATLFFSICQEGNYSLSEQNIPDNTSTSIISTRNSTINIGINKRNLIAVIVQGNTITLFINRTKIQTLPIDSNAEGPISFIAMSKANPTEVAYNNARIWAVPDAP